jgi:hypothetical protein
MWTAIHDLLSPALSIRTGRTERLAAECGALGVASGYAIFLTYRDLRHHIDTVHDLNWLLVWASVVLTAVASYFIEGVRELLARGGEEEEPASRRLHRALGTFSIVLLFEIYLAAIHGAVEQGLAGLREGAAALLGKEAEAPGALWATFWIALIWVVVGAALAVWLSALVRPTHASVPRAVAMGAGYGALGGLVLAPIFVTVYILVGRCALALQMITTNRGLIIGKTAHVWTDYVTLWHGDENVFAKLFNVFWYTPDVLLRFAASLGVGWFWAAYIGLIILLASIIALRQNARKDGPGLTGLAIAYTVVPPLIAPIIAVIRATAAHFDVILKLMGVAMFIWSVPGTILGALVPLLRREAKQPINWSLIGYGAAFLLVVTAGVNGWPLEPVLAAVVISIFAGTFLRRVPVRDYWPFAALCIALGLFSLSALKSKLTFARELSLANQLRTFQLTPESSLPLLPTGLAMELKRREFQKQLQAPNSISPGSLGTTNDWLKNLGRPPAENTPTGSAAQPLQPSSELPNSSALAKAREITENNSNSAADLENSITGSVGFWMTMALLACWAILERERFSRPSNEKPAAPEKR